MRKYGHVCKCQKPQQRRYVSLSMITCASMVTCASAGSRSRGGENGTQRFCHCTAGYNKNVQKYLHALHTQRTLYAHYAMYTVRVLSNVYFTACTYNATYSVQPIHAMQCTLYSIYMQRNVLRNSCTVTCAVRNRYTVTLHLYVCR